MIFTNPIAVLETALERIEVVCFCNFTLFPAIPLRISRFIMFNNNMFIMFCKVLVFRKIDGLGKVVVTFNISKIANQGPYLLRNVCDKYFNVEVYPYLSILKTNYKIAKRYNVHS